jgi:hypothetical protein
MIGESAHIRALAEWLLRYGTRDFEQRVNRTTASGLSDLVVLVEEGMEHLEGDMDLAGPVLFRWKSWTLRYDAKDWAFQYRKQSFYAGGYRYLDNETGEVLFNSKDSFSSLFRIGYDDPEADLFIDAGEGSDDDEEEATLIFDRATGDLVTKFVPQPWHSTPRAQVFRGSATWEGDQNAIFSLVGFPSKNPFYTLNPTP